MGVRAVRGAITLDENTKEEIIMRTTELLQKMLHKNKIEDKDIISIFFTATTDITAEFPAVAAREMNLVNVPLMCAHEMEIPHGISQCIRVMLHFETDKALESIAHVYLRGAERLRPDLIKE